MDAGDSRDDVRWLTYAELGQVRGISTASATRLAFRRKWRRQVGNDGTARVAVPVGEDKPADDDRTTKQGDVTPAIRVLEAAVSVLKEQLDRAEAGREAAARHGDSERVRADRAEAGREGERSRADAFRDRLDAAQVELHELRRADAARRSLGRLARLRAAWWGE